jgi:hypothetical protein
MPGTSTISHRAFRHSSLLLALAALGGAACSAPPAPPPADPLSFIAPPRAQEVVQQLTTPEMDGRGLAGNGLEQAATFLAGKMAEFGLQPGGEGGGFFQKLKVTTGVKLVNGRNWVRFDDKSGRRSLKLGIEFTPLSIAATDARAAGPLVFVGYGITAPEAGYDDYAGLDVKGKVVVAMRFAPGERMAEGTPDAAPPAGTKRIPALYQELRFKAMNAREHGAAALIVITGPRSEGGREDALLALEKLHGADDAGIPVVHVIRPVLEELLGAQKIQDAQEALDTTFTPRSFEAEETTPPLRLQTALERQQKEVANVVGLVPGADPALKNEIVVVGAHYDHLGHGGPGSLAPDEHKVHPGADDNASGVAAMLAIAEAAAKGPKLKRTVAFVAFAGEEVGLRGSSYFVAHPVPGKLFAMLNLDMVGRLRGQKLIVDGAGSAKEWPGVVEAANTDKLTLALGGDGYGPSDMTPFYARGVPVLFFFTGAHADYHRPTDTADKLNYDGLAAIAKLGYRVIREVADRGGALTYVRTAPRPVGEGGRGYGPYLGTIPDFSEMKGAGVKLTGVRKNSPAEKAGIQAGDVIVKLGEARIRNLEEYAIALRQRKPGDKVKITVARNGQELTVEATLEQRR